MTKNIFKKNRINLDLKCKYSQFYPYLSTFSCCLSISWEVLSLFCGFIYSLVTPLKTIINSKKFNLKIYLNFFTVSYLHAFKNSVRLLNKIIQISLRNVWTQKAIVYFGYILLTFQCLKQFLIYFVQEFF